MAVGSFLHEGMELRFSKRRITEAYPELLGPVNINSPYIL
jgi:hypothetical protein